MIKLYVWAPEVRCDFETHSGVVFFLRNGCGSDGRGRLCAADRIRAYDTWDLFSVTRSEEISRLDMKIHDPTKTLVVFIIVANYVKTMFGLAL